MIKKIDGIRLLMVVCMVLCGAVRVGAVSDRVSVQALDKDWSFMQVRGHNRYSATVPGVVHTDLMDNGLLEDPYFRLNERGAQWIDKEDWEYECRFVPSRDILDKSNIELYFEGLDAYAGVYLNDSLVLKANNMFREWSVNAKGILHAGENVLRVYFHSPIKVDIPNFDAMHYPIDSGNDQSENGGVFDKKVGVFARKAGYHYGWDWGPRLVTSGIWRPVSLIGWDGVRIKNVFYRQDDITMKAARVDAIATIESDRAGMATVRIEVKGVKGKWEKRVAVEPGVQEVSVPMVIRNPKLWWTHTLGEPHRYDFTTTVTMDGDSDCQTVKIGLRKIEVIRDADDAGRSFYFRLNGVDMFAKGANYIPQDNLLPRVTPARHRKTIEDAVNDNMNMLRIWGGGVYEDNVFYDLCDEYGLLIWQDFMFACSTYPMNAERLENIRQEAIDNVVRLRNHPCLAIWCGNNEMHTAWFNWGWMRKYSELGVLEEMRKDYKDVFDGVLPEVVAEYDPTLFYWPSSPYGGDPDGKCESGKENWNPNGDGHYWGVWHAKDSIASYNRIRARFFSEYGFQSFPEYQSVLQYAPESRDHDIYSDVMMAHQRGGKHANGLIEWYMLNEYKKPADFESFLYLSQLLQGDAIRTAMEAHRRDMPYCMGSLFWQHNDCWPVASWSSRDYYGRWKAQHYFTKKAYAPLLVSPIAHGDTLEVYIVSDLLKETQGVLDVQVMDLKGNVVYADEQVVRVPANSSRSQFCYRFADVLGGRRTNEVVVYAKFSPADKSEPVEATYFMARQRDIDLPEATIERAIDTVEGGYEVTLTSDVFARGVFLCLEGLDYFVSDNYFDLLPGVARKVLVGTGAGTRWNLAPEEFMGQLKVFCLNEV